jgi:hypothetical protein
VRAATVAPRRSCIASWVPRPAITLPPVPAARARVALSLRASRLPVSPAAAAASGGAHARPPPSRPPRAACPSAFGRRAPRPNRLSACCIGDPSVTFPLARGCARQRAPQPPPARLPRRTLCRPVAALARRKRPAPRSHPPRPARWCGRLSAAPPQHCRQTESARRVLCRERSKLSRQRHQRDVRRTLPLVALAPRRQSVLHRRCTFPPPGSRAALARLRLARCRSAQLRPRHRPRPLPPKLRSAARRFRPPAAEPMCGRSCGRPPHPAHGPQLRPHIGSAAPRRRRRGSLHQGPRPPTPPPAPQLARSRGFKITRFCTHVSPTAR